MVGITQVADRAGVSVGTVSNFFNRPDVLAPQTKDRVREAIEELGYVRNSSARDLRVGKSRSIGLLVLDIGNPFFTDLIEGVEEVANESGLTVTLGNSREDTEKEAAYLDLFAEQRVSGIIVAPVAHAHSRLSELQRQGTPVVLVDDGADVDDFCSVAVDDRRGGALAMRHLAERGCGRAILVTGPSRIHQAHARVNGAHAAAEKLGLALDAREAAAFTAADAKAVMREVIAEGAVQLGSTGVFAANDVMALGVMQALHEAGMRVPEDVSVIGYDDITYAAALSPSLSSVRQPSREMGREAMNLLLRERAGVSHAHHRTLFKPTLVARQTA